MPTLKTSVIIPARNEEGSVLQLYKELRQILADSYEIIFIDDGSTDNTFGKLTQLKKRDKKIKVIRFKPRYENRIGKSEALMAGFKLAKGKIVITMDADLQDDPREIPKFIKMINSGYDLVSGWKKRRYDPLSKKIPSKLGNFVTRSLTGVHLHDFNCGFKAYRKEVVKKIDIYGELYKFIPVLAAKQDFKIGELVVKHRKRKFGKSKFSWERNTKGILDLITIVFLTSYTRRPSHFFGTFGLISFGIGFLIGLYITYLRITTGSIQYRHPLLFFGMLLMIIGVQLISTGLLAEMIVYSRPRKENV